jgi:hypothetical protein
LIEENVADAAHHFGSLANRPTVLREGANGRSALWSDRGVPVIWREIGDGAIGLFGATAAPVTVWRASSRLRRIESLASCFHKMLEVSHFAGEC